MLDGDTLPVMPKEDRYCVVELASLDWPKILIIPSIRFRLFAAADMTSTTPDAIAHFAREALRNGMVYFCAWGPDCERFHDIVDEVIVSDDMGDRLFAGPNKSDTVMTTWHSDETLEEALDFFVNNALPTAGFEAESNYWVVVSVNSTEWTSKIRRQLEAAES